MADLFAKHPNFVKDMVVAETICPLHQEPVKVRFELNGVRGKLTVLDECSILHMGEKCNEACRKDPVILSALHQKMEEFREESAREIPIISMP
ncbi:MAG: hypothetical protein Q8L77_04960 [Nitrospirota bacterium]|nr:hypothetical protein [Nitrospirota bacterium]